ncbi:unnamed protein product [Merluccius merluccius]
MPHSLYPNGLSTKASSLTLETRPLRESERPGRFSMSGLVRGGTGVERDENPRGEGFLRKSPPGPAVTATIISPMGLSSLRNTELSFEERLLRMVAIPLSGLSSSPPPPPPTPAPPEPLGELNAAGHSLRGRGPAAGVAGQHGATPFHKSPEMAVERFLQLSSHAGCGEDISSGEAVDLQTALDEFPSLQHTGLGTD